MPTGGLALLIVELHSPYIQWLVNYWDCSLYKRNWAQWTTYNTCRYTKTQYKIIL